MSVNLVDLVLKQVGGNVPGILGSLLGESADRTQGAIAGAIPAVLGGLMGAASKGGGLADQLASAVGQQDDSMLDNLTSAFGGGNHQQIAEQGSSLLSSLLGDGAIGTLVGALGKFSGLGGGSTKSLLGMLVPIVMSVLGREQKSQGLDGGGLMTMLMGQKDNIQAAMPSGMASALGGAGFLDDLMGGVQSATASVKEAVDTATDAVDQAAGQAAAAVGGAVDSAGDAAQQVVGSTSAAVSQAAEAAGRAAQDVASGASQAASGASAAAAGAAQSGGSWLRWLLPLLILLALLWFAFKFLAGGDMEQAVSDASDAASSAVEATTEAAGDVVDAASNAATAVTDAASDAADAAGDVVTAATDAASDATDAATDAASDAATAVTDTASDAADTATETESSAVETMTAMVGDIDVGGELTSTFDGLTETLSGITDTASAEAALPALEDVSTGLDSLTGLVDQLPEGAVGGISEMASSGLSSLDGVVASLEAIPGVGDLIKPIIDQIKEKLAAFTPA
ncbi:MAG: DUF937 domain-containing protein [Geminicoccaceae bacterium]